MKCPKVGCLHWIPRGCLYIGVHGGFTRVVVKRLGNKMTRLTPLLSRAPGETRELSTESLKIFAESHCKEASEWKEINFLIYSTIIGGAEINNRILQSFAIKHSQHFFARNLPRTCIAQQELSDIIIIILRFITIPRLTWHNISRNIISAPEIPIIVTQCFQARLSSKICSRTK